MAKFERFEDILAWQKTRELVGKIYRITADSKFAKDFGLRDQIRRAFSFDHVEHRRRFRTKNE